MPDFLLQRSRWYVFVFFIFPLWESVMMLTMGTKLIFRFALDFCLWAPPEKGKNVGDIEGEMVAWCSKPGHGTRLIPAGALTGLQFIKTPDYIQAVGFLDQTLINMVAGDFGGEMDPHGADLVCRFIFVILFSHND